jgi:hypothetical protein
MNIAMQAGWGLILLAAWAVSAHAQVAEGHPTSLRILVSSLAASVPAEQPVPGAVVREIDDPHNGDHWLLLRDSSRPGAPGRMVLASAGAGSDRQTESKDFSQAASRQANRELSIPVIHSGDRLIVEEDTRRVQMRLEAVALGQAASGASLNVRLAFRGNVVRAIALGPGRAAFAQGAGVRP